MRQTNLLWTGLLDHSLENCLLSSTKTGSIIDSVIVGLAGSTLYRVEYLIKTDLSGLIQDCQMSIQLNQERQWLHLQHNGKGDWLANNRVMPQYQGCTDIDISLTPFTNSLPINRLHLINGQTQLIQVVYIDVLAQHTVAVQQRYTRHSATTYRYENVPNDFEALLTVDNHGLIVEYPGLFVRSAQG